MTALLARWAFHRGRRFYRVWRWLDLPEPCRSGDRYWFSGVKHGQANTNRRCVHRIAHWLIGRHFEAQP